MNKFMKKLNLHVEAFPRASAVRLHIWGIYITSSYMRVSLATEVGILVSDGSLGFGAKYCSSQSNIHPSQRGVGPT